MTERGVKEPVHVRRVTADPGVDRILVRAGEAGIVTVQSAQGVARIEEGIAAKTLVNRDLKGVVVPYWLLGRRPRDRIATASRFGTNAFAGVTDEVGLISVFI